MKQLGQMIHILIISVICQIILTTPHKVAFSTLTSYEVQEVTVDLKLSGHIPLDVPPKNMAHIFQKNSAPGNTLLTSHTIKAMELLFSLHNSLPPPLYPIS